jgi:magnesium-transporting ATPase (P-type)
MAPVVFVIQGAISKNWKGAVVFAISVAVGITPEMLPMVVVRFSICLYNTMGLIRSDLGRPPT